MFNKRVLAYWLCVFICFSSASQATDSYYGDQHEIESPNALDFEKLVALVQRRHIKSTRQLLRAFNRDEKFRPLLSNFVLLHHSESAQSDGVDFQHPRAILFKDRLILGLVGNAKFPENAASVEVLDYGLNQERFRPRRFDFSGRQTRIMRDPARESAVNCNGCHGNFHPIWSAYPLWSEAYGSNHDFIGRVSSDGRSVDGTEARQLFSFLEHRRGMYRWLKFPSPLWTEKGSRSAYLANKPNAKFSDYLSRLNFRRIFFEMKSHGELYSKIRYGVAGAILGCTGIRNFFPPAVRRQFQTRLGMSFDELRRQTEKLNEAIFISNRDRHFSYVPEARRDFHSNPDGGSLNVITSLRYVVEGAGISMEDWSMNQTADQASYSFATPRRGLQDLLRFFIYPDITSDDNRFPADLINASTYFLDTASQYCGALREASLGTWQ